MPSAEDKLLKDVDREKLIFKNKSAFFTVINKRIVIAKGLKTPELLEEVKNSKNFCFDKLCQMKMPSWTKGRVGLVGDAGYCASPAVGRGGSLAIDGVAALTDAFQKCDDNFELALQEYNKSFRPFIEEVRVGVVGFGLEVLIPKTEEAIRKRNIEGFSF